MKHRHFRESSPHDCVLALVDERGSCLLRAHGRSIDDSPPDGLGGTMQSVAIAGLPPPGRADKERSAV